MASAFDDLASKIPKGEMGGADPKFVTDFLGRQAPLSFSGQPALPAVAAGTPSSGPSGPSGTGGTGEKAATGLLATPEGAKADISGTGPAATGGDTSSEGPGAPGVGQATDAAAGPGNIGLNFGFGPGQFSIGPTGTVSVGARGGTTTEQGLASALNAALSVAGVPTSVNVPSLIASLTGSGVLGVAAQLAGMFGAPFTLASLAHAIAGMSPTSVTSLQAALADPNPEAQLTAAQALALAQGGARGPTVGGPQSATGLSSDAPATGPSGAQFGLDFSNPSVRSGFEAQSPKANAFEDVGAPPAPPDVPDITATGDVGIGGGGAGTGAPSAGSDSGEGT